MKTNNKDIRLTKVKKYHNYNNWLGPSILKAKI